MRRGDGVALLGYALVAVATVAVAEGLCRRGVPNWLTRKLIHVTAGLGPLYLVAVAEQRAVALLPLVATLAANSLLWRGAWLPSLGDQRGSLGIVLFPLAQLLLLAWGTAGAKQRAALGGLLALGLGDAAAALVGQQWGRRRYRVAGATRSVEGSAALFLVTAIACRVVLAGQPQGTRRAALAALSAASSEALSPRGFDNLTVPVAVAATLYHSEGRRGLAPLL